MPCLFIFIFSHTYVASNQKYSLLFGPRAAVSFQLLSVKINVIWKRNLKTEKTKQSG